MRFAQVALLAVLLACACMEQAPAAPVCNKPYIAVGAVCCLDENGDGICDKDKPICNKPYILVGNGCCPDANGNGLCDRDEPASTTLPAATTTTSASQTVTTTSIAYAPDTTVVSQKQCAKVEDCPDYYKLRCDEGSNDYNRVINDTYGPISCSGGVCIYRANRDMGSMHCDDWEVCVNGVGCVAKEDTTTTTTSTTATSSTGTTVPAKIQRIFDRVAERDNETAASLVTTTTLPVTCYDADGGIKPEIRSLNVSGYFEYNRTFISDSKDYCQDDKNVVEFYCQSSTVQSRAIECAGRCMDSRCCVDEGRKCASDKDCCNGACRMVGVNLLCV